MKSCEEHGPNVVVNWVSFTGQSCPICALLQEKNYAITELTQEINELTTTLNSIKQQQPLDTTK